MKKKTILALIGCISVWTISSCEDIIDVDLRTAEPQPVIEGVIRMGEYAEVRITTSKAFGDSNDYPPVTDATVTVTAGGRQPEALSCDEQGRYVATTVKGEERTTYFLSVTYNGVEYTATSYMPPRVEIDSLTVWKMPMKNTADPQIHFRDPAGEENQYYRCVLSVNGVRPAAPKDRLRDRLISTAFTDGNVIRQPVFIGYEVDREDDPVRQGDTVTVEMQCLDKDVYTFFETLYNVEDALANPVSNIKGGALGYFGAYSFTSKDIVMEWKD